MKKWLSYIISAAIACLCHSCSGDEVVTGTDHNGSGNSEGIVIRLGITSRAEGAVTTGGDDGKHITSLKVWMVHEEDDNFSFYKEINNPEGITFDKDDIYRFIMEISVLKPGNYGFYILANSENLSNGDDFNKNTKPSDLKAAYFTAISGGNAEGAESAIPMFGEYHSVTILSDKHDYEVQVPLMRVLSKLELFFAKAEEVSQLEITSLQLAKIPNKGYVVPRTDWTGVTYNAVATLLDSPVEIASHSTDFTHDNFQLVTIAQPYIFENPNGSDDATLGVVGGNAYQLTINYELNGKAETQVITLPAIARNTQYQLYARILEKTKKFILRLNVKPWNLIETEVDFTDVVTYSVTGWTDGTYREITDDNEVYMKRNTATEFKFGIDAPKDCEYMVALSNSVDFDLTETKGTDGVITVTVSAKNTDENRQTSLSIFAKTNGRWVELDVTAASGQQTSADESVNRYTIIQNWN